VLVEGKRLDGNINPVWPVLSKEKQLGAQAGVAGTPRKE